MRHMNQLYYTKTTGKEIQKIVEAMEPLLKEHSSYNVMMACLALAIITQFSDLTPEQLSAGVKGASEWIAVYVSAISNPEEKAN